MPSNLGRMSAALRKTPTPRAITKCIMPPGHAHFSRPYHDAVVGWLPRDIAVKWRLQVMANTREPILQPIPILSLHPTQMTVGMREVGEKRKRLREHWRKHKKIKQGEFLGRHMIPVVLGPDQRHYVVDHHHLARALHDEGVEDIIVTVIADLTM